MDTNTDIIKTIKKSSAFTFNTLPAAADNWRCFIFLRKA